MVWQKRGSVLFLAVAMALSMLVGCTSESGKEESAADYMKRENPELYGYINGRLDALEGR